MNNPRVKTPLNEFVKDNYRWSLAMRIKEYTIEGFYLKGRGGHSKCI